MRVFGFAPILALQVAWVVDDGSFSERSFFWKLVGAGAAIANFGRGRFCAPADFLSGYRPDAQLLPSL